MRNTLRRYGLTGAPLLWKISVSLFVCGLAASSPAHAQVPGSETTHLAWPQISFMLSIAAAWGDMRAQVRSLRKEMDDIREEQKRQHKED